VAALGAPAYVDHGDLLWPLPSVARWTPGPGSGIGRRGYFPPIPSAQERRNADAQVGSRRHEMEERTKRSSWRLSCFPKLRAFVFPSSQGLGSPELTGYAVRILTSHYTPIPSAPKDPGRGSRRRSAQARPNGGGSTNVGPPAPSMPRPPRCGRGRRRRSRARPLQSP